MDVRQLKYALKSNKDRNVYIGRGEKARNLPRSPLSNPFFIKNWKDDKARDESVELFRVYLWKVMKNPKDPRHDAVWSELRKLKEDSILLCYCYPKNCHGHVIVAAWKWAVAEGMIDAPRKEPPMMQTRTSTKDEERMIDQARANAKELAGEHIALGPLDMTEITARLRAQMDDRHEEGKIIQHVCTPDTAHLIDARLDEQIREKCTCVPAKPRNHRRPRLSFDEPRSLEWNEYDDVTADLADMAPCLGPHAGMSPGLIKYQALTPDERAEKDAQFDKCEEAYEATQLAMNHAA